MEEPGIELLLVLSAQTRATSLVTEVPGGDRMIFDVIGGSFEGPGLRGQVKPSGSDWVRRIGMRSRLDVRLLLETHDGATLLLEYRGRAHQANGVVRIEVVGGFEASAGPYDWLNDVQTFGLGTVGADSVSYRFYRFK